MVMVPGCKESESDQDHTNTTTTHTPQSYLQKQAKWEEHNWRHIPAINWPEEDLSSPDGYYPVRIGEVFTGRYTVINKLGWGVSSNVWLALDSS